MAKERGKDKGKGSRPPLSANACREAAAPRARASPEVRRRARAQRARRQAGRAGNHERARGSGGAVFSRTHRRAPHSALDCLPCLSSLIAARLTGRRQPLSSHSGLFRRPLLCRAPPLPPLCSTAAAAAGAAGAAGAADAAAAGSSGRRARSLAHTLSSSSRPAQPVKIIKNRDLRISSCAAGSARARRATT